MNRKTMNMKEFRDLMNYINEKHRFARGGRGIKYVEPVFDMRHGDIFCIKFRGWYDKEFSLTNENSDRNLKDWIYFWLLEKEK